MHFAATIYPSNTHIWSTTYHIVIGDMAETKLAENPIIDLIKHS